MRKAVTLAVAVGTLACATSARAEGFGIWFGSQSPYRYAERGGGDWAIRAVCSGERAGRLEGRIRHEEAEGELDPRTAARIHDAIDRLEDRSRDECEEGDRRSIWRIAQQYDQIQGWIESEAHAGWRSGW